MKRGDGYMRFLKRIKYNSPVILTFALVSLLTLLVGYLTKGASNLLLFSVYQSTPADLFFYLRLFGHVLGHVSLEHYVNNFVLILIIGPILEEKYGSKLMLLLILLTAVITGAVHILLSPGTALMGASGIVFMLILLGSYVNLQQGRIPLTLILAVAIFIGQEIAAGILDQDNISQMAHIIGGACGACLGFLINRNKFKTEETSETSEEE